MTTNTLSPTDPQPKAWDFEAYDARFSLSPGQDAVWINSDGHHTVRAEIAALQAFLEHVALEAARAEIERLGGHVSEMQPELGKLKSALADAERRLGVTEAIVHSALPVYWFFYKHVIQAHSSDPETLVVPVPLLKRVWQAMRPHYDPEEKPALDALAQEKPKA